MGRDIRLGSKAYSAMQLGLAERNRVRRYGGDESGRALHRDALVIKPQAVETAKLLAIASSTWSPVMTLRHHNAVPTVSINDGRIDRQHTAIGCAKFGHRTRKEVWIVAEHRHNQRSTAERDERERLRFVLVRNDCRCRPEDLGLVRCLRFRCIIDF